MLAAAPTPSSAEASQSASSSAARADEEVQSGTSEETDGARPRARGLRRYLEREVARSHHFLDHGVLAPEVGLGSPHIYRVGLRIGLFDHLTLGATMHWLPGEQVPAWSPLVAVAFYRGRVLELGAHYSRLLYPPPVADLDPETISFQRRADLLLGSLSLSQAWFSAGVDVGWARGLEADLLPESGDELNQTPVRRDRLAAGMHLRVGNRRWGVNGKLSYPFLAAEVAIDLRFGLFERRPKARFWAF